jgi:hypothetical protein
MPAAFGRAKRARWLRSRAVEDVSRIAADDGPWLKRLTSRLGTEAMQRQILFTFYGLAMGAVSLAPLIVLAYRNPRDDLIGRALIFSLVIPFGIVGWAQGRYTAISHKEALGSILLMPLWAWRLSVFVLFFAILSLVVAIASFFGRRP